ncbi:MAG: hypothetical protein AMXMBFR8_20740 [Nevskiales bacterium]
MAFRFQRGRKAGNAGTDDDHIGVVTGQRRRFAGGESEREQRKCAARDMAEVTTLAWA